MLAVEEREIRMKQINIENVNTILTGEGVEPLPVNRITLTDGTDVMISVWKAGLWERLVTLLTGKVIVSVLGEKQPPIAIAAGFRGVTLENPKVGPAEKIFG